MAHHLALQRFDKLKLLFFPGDTLTLFATFKKCVHPRLRHEIVLHGVHMHLYYQLNELHVHMTQLL